MKHADEIVERVLFLEGVPNISAYDKILVGANVKQQLENDLVSGGCGSNGSSSRDKNLH